MDFLERIKTELHDYRRQQGLRSKTMVDTRCLLELIERFEQMDSEDRVGHNMGHVGLEYHLHNAILAVYHAKKRNSEETLLTIMETLTPVIKENRRIIRLKKNTELYK